MTLAAGSYAECNAKRALTNDGRLLAVVLEARDVPSRPCPNKDGKCLAVELHGCTCFRERILGVLWLHGDALRTTRMGRLLVTYLC